MGHTNIRIKIGTKVTGTMISRMELEHITILMEIFIRENG